MDDERDDVGNRRSKPYEVGYGKPPKEHQFPKGKSGNPGGRPPKRKPETNETHYERACNKMVSVVENGRRRRISRRELVYERMMDSACRGDDKAQKRFLDAEVRYGHLRPPEPPVEGGGVLVVGAPLTPEEWIAKHGGPQPIQTIPLLEKWRDEILKDDDNDKDDEP